MTKKAYSSARVQDMGMFGDDKIKTADLIIRVSFADEFPEDFPAEQAESLIGGNPENFKGVCQVESFIEVDADHIKLNAEHPQDYLNNGYIVGLLEAIRAGLSQPRGCSIESASDDAESKARSAVHALRERVMVEELGKLSLAVSEPEGEA